MLGLSLSSQHRMTGLAPLQAAVPPSLFALGLGRGCRPGGRASAGSHDDTAAAVCSLPLTPLPFLPCPEPSTVSAERRGSNLLTRQLQELWRKSRGSLVPQRLLFEVTSTSVVSERNSKYVVSAGRGAKKRPGPVGASWAAGGGEHRQLGSLGELQVQVGGEQAVLALLLGPGTGV